MGYFGKAIDFLKSPGKSFEEVTTDSLGNAFKYMLVLGILVSVLNGIVVGIMTSMAPIPTIPVLGESFLPIVIVSTMIFMYVSLIIGQTIYGLWLHLWVYIFGARKGLEQTVKSVYYGNTPSYLLGWIPVISIIFVLWSFVLTGMGLTKLQGMTGGRAALAIIISLVIPLIIAGALFAAFFFTIFSSVGGFPELANLGTQNPPFYFFKTQT